MGLRKINQGMVQVPIDCSAVAVYVNPKPGREQRGNLLIRSLSYGVYQYLEINTDDTEPLEIGQVVREPYCEVPPTQAVNLIRGIFMTHEDTIRKALKTS